MSADLRTQILTNAKFIFGPSKRFEVVTALVFLGTYGNIEASQGVLVEVDDNGAYKTYLVGSPAEHLADALESLHAETRKKIYQKLSETLEENAMIESGETVLEGSLDWS